MTVAFNPHPPKTVDTRINLGWMGCSGCLFVGAAAIAGGVTLGIKAIGWVANGVNWLFS